MITTFQSNKSGDYVNAYDRSLRGLSKDPSDTQYQHQAVLSLARAGSLDFALAEYKRYGLNQVRQHEDIMALGARLLKDLYLSHTGDEALEYARQSAQTYETAFEDTGGYYSGINSATMGLMAEMPIETIYERASVILGKLPDIGNADKETLYYVEATRAESFLLLGKLGQCEDALRRALQHDPLNYAAHATTLKQFSMVLKKRGENLECLERFKPPKAAHFAGHLFGHMEDNLAGLNALTREQSTDLMQKISDTIQYNDIGFGYGALAAGADILIAETLLAEGAELHVILPTTSKIFVSKSVSPYGGDWVDRFGACMQAAHSVHVVSHSTDWPNASLNCHASHVAMGQAIMRSQMLSADVTQLVIWDGLPSSSGTAKHVKDWQGYNRNQICLDYPATRQTLQYPKQARPQAQNGIKIEVSNGTAEQSFDTVTEAARGALLAHLQNTKQCQIGLHVGMALSADQQYNMARALASHAVPGGVLMSEDFAALLALENEDVFQSAYMGVINTVDNEDVRVFALSAARPI